MAYVKTIEEQEKALSEKLIESCFQDGREICPRKSAEIFYKLGLLYKRKSPDKICLLQSAALLNAAIVRNPDGVKCIETDLNKLCKHILNIADAKNQKADLMKYAQQVKNEITELRLDVQMLLQGIEKIPEKISNKRNLFIHEQLKVISMQMIQDHISSKYIQIMNSICHFCETTMGKPPCAYALVGMGSLARKEITPYSDFEHIIVLEESCQNEANYYQFKNYFRWLSVIFHVIVINLGETIIPSVCIPYLIDPKTQESWFKDFVTPRGISFDGMMPHASKFPLGRTKTTSAKPFTTELIQPISEMLKYLSSKEGLKNDYHLSDILTKTCFVSGKKELCDQFQSGVQLILKSRDQNELLDDIKKEVKEDLNNYGTKSSFAHLQQHKAFNFKRVIYRSTTLFISALGKLYNIDASSSFDAVEKLLKKNLISENTRNKLMFAIAVACEIRLRIYQERNRQDDWTESSVKWKSSNEISQAVGERTVINYFQIASCLQKTLMNRLQIKDFYCNTSLTLTNINILYFMEKRSNVMTLIQRFSNYQQPMSASVKTFDEELRYLENEISILRNAFEESYESHIASSQSINNVQMGELFLKIGNILFNLKKFDDAKECFEKAIHIFGDSSGSWEELGQVLDFVSF